MFFNLHLMRLLTTTSSMITALSLAVFFFFSSRRRHTRLQGDWSSDVCSSDLPQTPPTSMPSLHRPPLGNQQPFPPPGPPFQQHPPGFFPGPPMPPKEVIPEEIGRASCRERV